jgi:hypothetical protein
MTQLKEVNYPGTHEAEFMPSWRTWMFWWRIGRDATMELHSDGSGRSNFYDPTRRYDLPVWTGEYIPADELPSEDVIRWCLQRGLNPLMAITF